VAYCDGQKGRRRQQVIPDDSFPEGVPAVVKKGNTTDEGRLDYFGLLPSAWTRYEAERIEANIRERIQWVHDGSFKQHAKSSPFGVVFDQPGSGSEAVQFQNKQSPSLERGQGGRLRSCELDGCL
jgi:hypothetical protein